MAPYKGKYANIAMNGKEVYKFATRKVPTVIEEALGNAGLGVEEVDWLLLHQANIRIMDVVADRLGMPKEKVSQSVGPVVVKRPCHAYYTRLCLTHRTKPTNSPQILTNLSDYGNTSAGSIPLALDEAVRAGKVKKGDIIACAGFGAGLSWGSAIIKYGGSSSS